MFGLFKQGDNEKSLPPWAPELQQASERWFFFLEKLEAKMDELCTAAIPELKDLLQTDDDIYKRSFYRVQSGVRGQLENIRQKASETYDGKILATYYERKDDVSVTDPAYDLLSDFRDQCCDRHNIFEDKYRHWYDAVEATAAQDLEIEYQKILAEYETVKNKFNCKQCGGNICIEKPFFIDTYISCSHCHTQNTYEPSTQAKMLQHIAQGLAEQRTVHLLEAYNKETSLERELYHQAHTLKLSTIHEKDKKVLAEKNQQLVALEDQRQQAIANAPRLYKTYLRAKFDECNSIIPDMKEHHEKMYQSQVNAI